MLQFFVFALSRSHQLKLYMLVMSNSIIFKTFSETHFSDAMCMYFSYVSNDIITDIINLFILLSKVARLYKSFEYFFVLALSKSC